MLLLVNKFVSACGNFKDMKALKCLKLSHQILATLKGTAFTIDDRSKVFKKFMAEKYGEYFKNTIAEEDNLPETYIKKTHTLEFTKHIKSTG